MGLEQAIKYLLDTRSSSGNWSDFDTLAGQSDEWVTAYIATHLAGIRNTASTNAARLALRWLHRRRWFSTGWGYNSRVPVDVDSTAWTLQLGARLGQTSRQLERALEFIERSSLTNGALPTYPRSASIRRFTKLAAGVSFNGWCQAHPCVTAVAAPLLRNGAAALDYLRKMQLADGSWTAYWWVDREYSTAAAVACLKSVGTLEDCDRIKRAATWAASRLSPNGAVVTRLHADGSPFATALCVAILRQGFGPSAVEARETAIAWLFKNQRHDGSWVPSAELRIPPPDNVDPDNIMHWSRYSRGAGAILNDQHRTFTTATVLAALA